MECPVCYEPYDLERRRPKVLVPCGHSVCLHCLQDPGFGKLCPQDRKPFQGEPLQLPDCMTAINIIAQGGVRPRPALWCRDCSADFSDQCADDGHTPCSLKKLRTEQAASQLQALQRGVAASAALQQNLAAVKQDVQEKIGAHKAAEVQLQDAVAKLQAATEGQAGFKQAMDAAELLLPLVERLEESASLAGLRGRCSVVVQAEDGAEEWRASVALEDGKRHTLRNALRDLRDDGDLVKVVAEPDGTLAAEGLKLDLDGRPPCDMCVDVIADVVGMGSLAQVRSLTGVDCAEKPRLCELLLQTVAANLEELEMKNPQQQHMEVLSAMPSLRKLSLTNSKTGAVPNVAKLPVNLEELLIREATFEHMRLVGDLKSLRKLHVACQMYWMQALDLPPQLEELTLESCSRQHLSSIQRMPGLRRLFLNGVAPSACDFSCPPLPPGHCGLSWLKLATSREVPVLSLIRAHAATLQEIQLVHSSMEAGRPPHVKDLAACLRECSFPLLRRLVLLRRPSDGWTPAHTAESCHLQVCELRVALRSRNRALPVVCDVCDKELMLH